MFRILLCLSVFCLATLTNGQQTPEPPRITNFLKRDLLAPEDVKFRTDDAMKLPCAASGNNLKWTWKHNDTEISAQQIQHGNQFKVSSDGTLTGSNLGTTQSGNYQCFVKDTVTNVQTFSRKIQVAVTVVGKFVPLAPDTEVKVDLGEQLSYNCPSHEPSYGVSYSWQGKLSDTNIQFKRNERRAISQTGQLYIMYVTQEDFDEIAEFQNQGLKCWISAANSFQDSHLVKITKKTPGKPDPGTLKAPTWQNIPGNEETAIEGRNKTLYCLAVGRPVPSITWKKLDGGTWKDLVHGEDSYEIASAFQGRLLNIISVQRNLHETRYRCEALNTQSNGIAIVHETNLKVEVAPKWTQAPPDEVTIDIYGNRTLTCDVVADPVPSFVWYKNGNKITTSTIQVTIDNNKLIFYKVRYPEEAGVYQCVAENLHGMVVSHTWIKVLAIKPSFNEFGPFYLFKDSEGRLKCNPEAAPRPNIFKWHKGGVELKTTPYSVEADGTLVINTVTRERDQGEYECYAANFLGNDTAKASATVLDPTRIIKAPRNKKIDEGTRVDLRCEATADSSLELRYMWKRDNAIITYNNRIQWLEGAKVLTIADITVDFAAIYTCCAYTPEPKKSEDCKSATVDIAGVPNPLTVKSLTECHNRTTTLEWIPGAANNASITHFLIEQESAFEPNVFRVIANVTNPNATSVSLNLTGWATLRFRVRAVNRFGPSRASSATTQYCQTKLGVPDKYPDDFRGVPKKAEQLDIAWTAMPKVDWNAPGLYYILNYRSLEPTGPFVTEKISDPTVNVFAIPNPGSYEPWEFTIQSGNDQGLGPVSPLVKSFSGQDPPADKPEDVRVGAVTARTVELAWKPVTVTRGSVDGYRIYYWGESRLTARRRRAIPAYANSVDVQGGNIEVHTVTGLTPYTNYNFAIKAFNSGGEGPGSDEAFAPTEEAIPGPPSDVQVYTFAKYILVTWQAPLEPNGIITKYRVGSQEYSGSQPAGDLVINLEEIGADQNRKLLGNQTPEKNYVVEIQAQTSIGWGEKVQKTTRTVKYAGPAKPERPTVEGIAVDKVKVTYNFGLGGGYTHEFLVMYRQKLEGEPFMNTSWVNHFETQSTEIGNLSPDLYEFKTVGRNDYPEDSNVNSKTESTPSDVTEGRPLPGVVNAGQRSSTPIHKTAWFIALLVLIAILLIVLLIFVLYTRHQGAKYPVGKRERKRAALIEQEPYDEEEGAFSNAGRTENPPPYQSEGSLQKSPDSDRDSLDDYGEGPQFNEDGSFIGEYGDEKKAAPNEKDESAFATFV